MTGPEKPEVTAAQEPPDASPDPPEQEIAEAKAAFGRRTEGELAVLVLDTLIEGCDSASDHLLRFEHPDLTLHLHILATPAGSSLHGTVEPVTPLHVQGLEFQAKLRAPRCRDAANGTFAFEGIRARQMSACIWSPPARAGGLTPTGSASEPDDHGAAAAATARATASMVPDPSTTRQRAGSAAARAA